MRGVVSGSLWALIISGVGLGIVSQVNDPPRPADLAQTDVTTDTEEVTTPQPVAEPEPVETPEIIAETDPVVAQEVTEQPAVAPEPEIAVVEPTPPAAPDAVAPLSDNTDNVLTVPPTAEAETAPEDDVIAPERPVLSGATDASDPVITVDNQSTEQLTPDEPLSEPDERDAIAGTEDLGVIAPVTAPEEAGAITVEETVPDLAQTLTPEAPVETAEIAAPTPDITEPEEQPQADAPVEQPAIDDLLADLQNPDNFATPPEAADVPFSDDQFAGTSDDDGGRAIATRPSPVVVGDDQQSDDLAAVLGTTEPLAPIAPDEPVVQESEQSPVTEIPSTDEPVTTEQQDDTVVAQDTGAVRVNRPSPAATPQPEQEPSEEVEVEEAPSEVVDPDAPAILRYAAEFENTDALPLVNMLLLDDGRVPSGNVIDLGLPVTVILDPLAPDAGIRMDAYRKAGIEVGLRAGLPTGATPSDVEVAMEAALSALPQSVVLYSDGQDGVQSSRSVSEQIVQILAAEGRGLVAVSRGFGNALRFAEQANVPAIGITRNLDDLGENEAAIGRALDQTAFRARQSGNAVVVAETSTYMLSALRTWARQNDGDQLRLAPVTAVLGITTVEDPATDEEEGEVPDATQ